MQTFNTLPEAFAAIEALPGFILGIRRVDNDATKRTATADPAVFNYSSSTFWEYAQETADGSGYKLRRAVIVEQGTISFVDGSEVVTPVTFGMSLPHSSETPEGLTKVISSVAGPDLYYPWVESLGILIDRNGLGALALDVNKQPTADPGSIAWYVATERLVITEKSGMQQALGAWSRCNEGDHVAVSIEMPDGQGGWLPVPTPGGGTIRFANKILMHGTNTAPQAYPPNAPANLSWIPAGLAIRVDFFKKAVNDPELATERGPYLDVDFILWRERALQ